MFDQVPVQVWLLIAIGAVAYSPAHYVYRHITHSPSRRDITQPSEDLSWRSSTELTRSLIILVGLSALGVFIFTPTAAHFARLRSFFPLLIAALGAWSLSTVPVGFARGHVQPFIRGINDTYGREVQPIRFWASLSWNLAAGVFCIWLAFSIYQEASAKALQTRCYNQQTTFSPQEMLAACNELISQRDNSPSLLADYIGGRGIAYHRLGDYRRAIADYSEAIRLNPRDYYPYYNRALAYQERGDTRRALADYTAAIDLLPNDADAYLNRGLILLDEGRFDQAVADLTRAHELEPDDPWPLANRGIAYAWRRDRVRAQKDFAAVRAINPSNPVLLRGEAILSMNEGNLTAAVDHLTESLKHDPDNRFALGTRARLYQLLGEDEKSRADTAKLTRMGKTGGR